MGIEQRINQKVRVTQHAPTQTMTLTPGANILPQCSGSCGPKSTKDADSVWIRLRKDVSEPIWCGCDDITDDTGNSLMRRHLIRR